VSSWRFRVKHQPSFAASLMYDSVDFAPLLEWQVQYFRKPGGKVRCNLLESSQAIVSVAQTTWTRRQPLTSYVGELRSGMPLARDWACQLVRCAGPELPVLLSAALEASQRFKPRVVTYSRKVFIPLTNLCRDYCGYCTFRRDPDQAGAHTMTPDQVLEVARAGEKMGCTEALFSLGDKPELAFPEMREALRQLGYKSTLHYLEAMCELVLRETTLLPHPNPGLMSTEWIARLAKVSPSMGLMLETTNASLLAAGAAHDNAPDKVPAKRLHTIEEAGKQNVPFTTGLLIGIGETPEDRVDTLLTIRELHRRYGHIQEVIIQNFRAKPEIPMHAWPEPTQGEMMRTIAVARLLMPDINIQAPPNLSAPYYDDLLDAGINDWGGISPLTPDFINPEKPWPHLEQLKLRTEAKGYLLRQRLPVYPEFLSAVTAGSSLLAAKVKAAADSEGYARRLA
jgi:FO synthase